MRTIIHQRNQLSHIAISQQLQSPLRRENYHTSPVPLRSKTIVPVYPSCSKDLAEMRKDRWRYLAIELALGRAKHCHVSIV